MGNEKTLRAMTDTEIARAIESYRAELVRRASIPEDKRPDPDISARLRKRHERLYSGR